MLKLKAIAKNKADVTKIPQFLLGFERRNLHINGSFL
jgi:hypothetical protein